MDPLCASPQLLCKVTIGWAYLGEPSYLESQLHCIIAMAGFCVMKTNGDVAIIQKCLSGVRVVRASVGPQAGCLSKPSLPCINCAAQTHPGSLLLSSTKMCDPGREKRSSRLTQKLLVGPVSTHKLRNKWMIPTPCASTRIRGITSSEEIVCRMRGAP